MKVIWDAREFKDTKNFISHMVQMKGVSSLPSSSLKELYIPHGSDESSSLSSNSFSPQSPFISHMVQMKENIRAFTANVLGLYIPHGSDESWGVKNKMRLMDIFISHMVQMKDQHAVIFFCSFFLFISHMVQMKVRI